MLPSVDVALACALAKRPTDRPSNLIDWAEALAADLRKLTAVEDVREGSGRSPGS